jgi:adenylylsulfate kinase
MEQDKKGYVLWVTGLSGAGKTTVATGVVKALEKLNIPAVMLDGDNLRYILASKWGYSLTERKELGLVYARLCQHLSDSGVNIVCSTVAMFDEIRSWNRENIENYIEIYLRVPVDILIERDSKGLYKKYKENSSINNKVILDEFELPTNPDILIDNYGDCSAEESEQKIVDMIMKNI